MRGVLRFYSVSSIYNRFYRLNRLTGSLLKNATPFYLKALLFPKQIVDELEIINNPFNTIWSPEIITSQLSPKEKKKLIRYRKIIYWLSERQFFLAVFYSSFSRPLFQSSQAAFSYLTNNFEGHTYGMEDCLKRTLLVAKTSKSFKNNSGTIYIGADFNSGIMHAFIFENINIQPDPIDRAWINYIPILAIKYD